MGKQLAAAITKYNDEDPSASIQVIHKDVPTKLKEGEVLVRMMLRPINPSDMFCMRGRYGGFTPKQLPAVPGLEGPTQACMRTCFSLHNYKWLVRQVAQSYILQVSQSIVALTVCRSGHTSASQTMKVACMQVQGLAWSTSWGQKQEVVSRKGNVLWQCHGQQLAVKARINSMSQSLRRIW